MKPLRLFSALAAVFAFALVAASCSGDDPVSGAVRHAVSPEEVHAAPERALKAKTAKVEMRIDVSSGGQKVTSKAEGIIDFKNQAAKMDLEILGEKVQEVIVDGALYMKLPGAEWTKTDLDDFRRMAGINPDNVATSNNDPVQQMDALKDLEDVEFVADEKVKGVPAKHYRGYTDVVEQSRQLAKGDPQAEAVSELLASVLADPKLATDVWIDEEGRATRISTTFRYDWGKAAATHPELAAAAQLGTMTMKFQMDYFDWGAPVDIEAPI